jgi:hypothetical protein
MEDVHGDLCTPHAPHDRGMWWRGVGGRRWSGGSLQAARTTLLISLVFAQSRASSLSHYQKTSLVMIIIDIKISCTITMRRRGQMAATSTHAIMPMVDSQTVAVVEGDRG